MQPVSRTARCGRICPTIVRVWTVWRGRSTYGRIHRMARPPRTSIAAPISGSTSEQSYDALLLVSFGGPEGPEDVLPFLRNVTRGRNVPDERLAAVARTYERFG